MNTVLPFDGFLDVLRTKGYASGLRERFALAKLLERWEGTSSGEFRDALAALVGRSEGEVQGIRRLFNEVYKDQIEAPAALSPSERSRLQDPAGFFEDERKDGLTIQPRVRRFRSRWAWAGVAAVVAVAITLGVVVWRINQPALPPPVTPTPAPAVLPVPDLVPAALPPAPPLPAPPSILDARFVAGAFGAAFVLALSVFWMLKSREARRHWLRRLWSARFSALPGPHHFILKVRGRPAGLSRADVEDAATLLGRAFATDAPARELDVGRSVRLTLRHGLFPRVVFKQRRIGEAILVFQDVCQDMELWRHKVERFLTDVARQGVMLDRYYFDGDIRRVTHRPNRAPVPFDIVMRRRPDAPALVISTGSALGAVFDQGDDRWLIALRDRLRRSWLSPLVDVRLWPTELGALPVDVWPMTRRGLTQAAKDLAGIQGEASAALTQRIASEGLVTQDGVERMKRLASLVPHPTLDLLEVLRLRFAPDVSDAVFVHLFAETGSQTAPALRLSDEELRRCLSAVRGETPRLEAAVRQTIVETLRDSEPPAGSAAHLRWRAAVLLQELVLADLQGGDTTRPLLALRELGQGPTWEEIRRAARLIPSTPALTDKIHAALGTDGGRVGDVPPSVVARAAGRVSRPWLWPGAREIVPAALLAFVVFIGGRQLHLFRSQTLSHVEDAYRLAYVAAAQGAGQLLVQPGDHDNSTLPQRVDLYQGSQVFRSGIAVSSDVSRGLQRPGSIQLASADTGKYYQVRAQLPKGNLALSNALWVPSSSLVTVLIDASPWAHVTVKGASEDIRDQPTPLLAALAPGVYRLHFENTNLKLTMDRDITVSSSTNVFRYPMPGFDATATAAALLVNQPVRPTLPPLVQPLPVPRRGTQPPR
jgi:hypothetical protein